MPKTSKNWAEPPAVFDKFCATSNWNIFCGVFSNGSATVDPSAELNDLFNLHLCGKRMGSHLKKNKVGQDNPEKTEIVAAASMIKMDHQRVDGSV